jgi:hypothetical protein
MYHWGVDVDGSKVRGLKKMRGIRVITWEVLANVQRIPKQLASMVRTVFLYKKKTLAYLPVNTKTMIADQHFSTSPPQSSSNKSAFDTSISTFDLFISSC